MGASLLGGALFGSDPYKYDRPVSGNAAGDKYKEVTNNSFVANPSAQGYTPVANPYSSQTTPSWMSGWFNTPWWGQSPMGGETTGLTVANQPQPAQTPGEPTTSQGILDMWAEMADKRRKNTGGFIPAIFSSDGNQG